MGSNDFNVDLYPWSFPKQKSLNKRNMLDVQFWYVLLILKAGTPNCTGLSKWFLIYSEHNQFNSKTTFPISFQTGRRWPWRLRSMSHLSPSARVTMKNLCQREVRFCLQLHFRLLDLRTCLEYDILIWHRPDKIWSSSWILTSEGWVGRRGLNMDGSFIPPINPQKLSWNRLPTLRVHDTHLQTAGARGWYPFDYSSTFFANGMGSHSPGSAERHPSGQVSSVWCP